MNVVVGVQTKPEDSLTQLRMSAHKVLDARTVVLASAFFEHVPPDSLELAFSFTFISVLSC